MRTLPETVEDLKKTVPLPQGFSIHPRGDGAVVISHRNGLDYAAVPAMKALGPECQMLAEEALKRLIAKAGA